LKDGWVTHYIPLFERTEWAYVLQRVRAMSLYLYGL
jgi:hypothetical protein